MERVLYGKKTAYTMMSPGYSSTTASPKSEFLKLIDLMEYFFVSRPASGRREGFEYQRVMYFNPETENSSKQVCFFLFYNFVTVKVFLDGCIRSC